MALPRHTLLVFVASARHVSVMFLSGAETA